MSGDIESYIDRLEREIDRLKLELALRSGKLPKITIPVEQVHGQFSAFYCGAEHAWRGWARNNPYEVYTAQFRSWNRGFTEGAKLFARTIARAGGKAQ